MSRYDQRGAMDALLGEFPELRGDIDSSMAGLFYLEMGCFARYVQRQIDDGNRSELGRCYEWLRKLTLCGNEDVRNAVGVAVLEHLNTRDEKVARSWALEVMPPILRQSYEELRRNI